MYTYDAYDRRLVRERATQFRGQVERRLRGEITEDEFKPLRLQNGVYMQLHAYMLRVAIPYGLLSSAQLRMLAHIARTYDRGYGHFTTRQNIQYNWPALVDIPSILDDLSTVDMHAIQSSGNCIRNITSDALAGVAHDEVEDPRPYCEILRQWSTFHPEFAFLPRKFKIAVSGGAEDRAAVRVHDVGLRLVTNQRGEVGFAVYVGGGQGRTPIVAPLIREFLPKRHLLSYMEAILRTYNRFGRRDDKYKARIKIQVQTLGAERYRELVEEEWSHVRDGGLDLDEGELGRMQRFFAPPEYEAGAGDDTALRAAMLSPDRGFSRWVDGCVLPHRHPSYAVVGLPLKTRDRPPGDVTAEQMDAVAELSDRYSFGRIVVTHRQNLVLPDVAARDLPELYARLEDLNLTQAQVGKATDVIACPGLDYCNLANARSLNVSRALSERFDVLGLTQEIGDLTLNISGCVNACGHHHVGNIGILGIDKQGVEHYQLMVGGSALDDASFGRVLGPSLTEEEVPGAVERVVLAYLELRESDEETFLEAYRRLGRAPFKEAAYANR